MQQGSQPANSQHIRGRRWTRRLVIAFFIFLGIVVFLESPLTRVQTIQVTGNPTIPANAIIAASQLHIGMSIWQVNAKRVENSITSQETLVDSVDVQSNLFSRNVTLTVHEKHVVGILEYGGKFYDLLNDGVVFQQVSSRQGLPFPVVTVAGTPLAVTDPHAVNPDLADICKAMAGLQSSLLSKISELHLDQYGNVTVYFSDGFAAQCNVNSVSDVLPKMQEAIQYFRSKGYGPGFIDMTGQPPYRYTPFRALGKTGGKGSQP